MRRVEFEVDGECYRIELRHDAVLIMSQRCGGRWDEIARLTVAAASVLASLGSTGGHR